MVSFIFAFFLSMENIEVFKTWFKKKPELKQEQIQEQILDFIDKDTEKLLNQDYQHELDEWDDKLVEEQRKDNYIAPPIIDDINLAAAIRRKLNRPMPPQNRNVR